VTFSTLQDWLDWQMTLHSRSIDMGLDRIRPIFTRLITQRLATKVILVAGTNGKGSTVAFLESLYVSGGYRVGSYTSPHLLKYNERIRIDGTPVSDAQICEAFERIEACRLADAEERTITYFEFATFAAFDVFQRADLDVVILEVGLGGRLDAVNLIDADVAVISNIQLDHTEWLGDTREQIAREKLGIARKGRPLLIADDDLPENVLPYLSENDIPAYLLGAHFGYLVKNDTWDWWANTGQVFVTDEARDVNISKAQYQKKFSLPLPAMRGAHQFKNAAAALTVTALLNTVLPLSQNHIRLGLSGAALPGRFQMERVGDKTIILDVAHNPHGIQAFISNLRKLPGLGQNYLVFAMLKDKSLEEVICLLDGEVDHWLLAGIEGERSLPPSELFDRVSRHTAQAMSIKQFHCVVEACQYGLEKMQPNDHLLVVGSFLTVADALTLLKS